MAWSIFYSCQIFLCAQYSDLETPFVKALSFWCTSDVKHSFYQTFTSLLCLCNIIIVTHPATFECLTKNMLSK